MYYSIPSWITLVNPEEGVILVFISGFVFAILFYVIGRLLGCPATHNIPYTYTYHDQYAEDTKIEAHDTEYPRFWLCFIGFAFGLALVGSFVVRDDALNNFDINWHYFFMGLSFLFVIAEIWVIIAYRNE